MITPNMLIADHLRRTRLLIFTGLVATILLVSPPPNLGGVWHGTNKSLGQKHRITDDVLPTPYPLAFRIHFDTNVTRQSFPYNSNSDLEEPLLSVLYYDWNVQAQLIDHPAGSYECVRFYATTGGCKLYFLPTGMYRVIEPETRAKEQNNTEKNYDYVEPDFQPCCLDIPGLGAPPPDWAKRANPTFQGLVHDSYSGYDAYEFVFDHQQQELGYNNLSPNVPRNVDHNFKSKSDDDQDAPAMDIYDQFHTTREVHDGTLNDGTPLVFTFPSKAKGLQDFHFDPTSLVVGYQDPAIFQIPEECENVPCKTQKASVD